MSYPGRFVTQEWNRKTRDQTTKPMTVTCPGFCEAGRAGRQQPGEIQKERGRNRAARETRPENRIGTGADLIGKTTLAKSRYELWRKAGDAEKETANGDGMIDPVGKVEAVTVSSAEGGELSRRWGEGPQEEI
jgi:hypothetical protein